MARTAKDYKLDSASARFKLKPRRKAYYRQIESGLTLGYYRRDAANGKWEVRELVDGDYKYRIFAEADDLTRADGRDVLTYKQAHELASKPAPTAAPLAGKLTVDNALNTYLAALAARSRHADETRQRVDKWIRPTLGATRIARLTKTQVETWLAGMVREDTEDDPDGRRKSQDSANRILTVLKAALNTAFVDDANGIASDNAWRKVKPFGKVDAAREDHFEPVQVRTLIAKATEFDRPFASLCEAGYLTGARLGELVALEVRDFDAKRFVLSIRGGKTGAREVALTDESVRFFKRLAEKRLPGAILLSRGDGRAWHKSEQARRFKQAAAAADLPASASFYSLRHSHVSRAIEAGMPLSLVAENCGTSLTMIQKNYAKVLARTRRDVIQQTGPKLRRVK